jgi:hypothetical protein
MVTYCSAMSLHTQVVGSSIPVSSLFWQHSSLSCQLCFNLKKNVYLEEVLETCILQFFSFGCCHVMTGLCAEPLVREYFTFLSTYEKKYVCYIYSTRTFILWQTQY